GPLQRFVDDLYERRPPVTRVAGTAIFPNPSIETTPLAMRATVEHTHVLHRNVVVVSAEWESVPHVPPEDRVRIDDLGYADDGITHVTARFGFSDTPDLPRALRLAEERGLECDLDHAHARYFVSSIRIQPTSAPGMARWRKRLFVVLARNA